jgi:hypothetical protein
MEQPELGRVDLVPARALALLEQEQDRGRGGALAFGRLGAPCLAIPAAFRVRLELQGSDQGLDLGH